MEARSTPARTGGAPSRAAHPLVDELGGQVESTVRGDGAKLVELEADVLAVVRGGDAGVEGGSRRRLHPRSTWGSGRSEPRPGEPTRHPREAP